MRKTYAFWRTFLVLCTVGLLDIQIVLQQSCECQLWHCRNQLQDNILIDLCHPCETESQNNIIILNNILIFGRRRVEPKAAQFKKAWCVLCLWLQNLDNWKEIVQCGNTVWFTILPMLIRDGLSTNVTNTCWNVCDVGGLKSVGVNSTWKITNFLIPERKKWGRVF